jgi:carboxymethylenebutenolidase
MSRVRFALREPESTIRIRKVMSPMKESKICLSTDDGTMNAFLALPEKTQGASAVIVIQEEFGVNSHIQEVCRRLAREGFIALAPEMFHRSGSGLTFGYEDFKLMMLVFGKLNNEAIEMDIAASIRYLNTQRGVESRHIAVMGFSMGGFAAFLAACRLKIGTAVAFYGGGIVNSRPGVGLTPLLDEAKKIRVPVLCTFGGNERHIPISDIEAIRSELAKQPKLGHEISIYPQADHGFICEEGPSYHAEFAHDAWKKALTWLFSRCIEAGDHGR